MRSRALIVLATILTAVTTTAVLSSPSASAAGPPPADVAATSIVIGPGGGSISGFGITATFAAGAVAADTLIVLGNWPNGLDVPPPNGVPAIKTFGLQACLPNGTDCTSPFGDYPNSPSPGGTQKISGMDLQYTGFRGVTFGSAANKLVTITINTDGSKIYIYNPNFSDTADAYPTLLPSSSNGTRLTFSTFRPIVWTVTTALGASQ
jgi:hypothetical protein